MSNGYWIFVTAILFLALTFGTSVTSDKTIRQRMKKEKERAMHPQVDKSLLRKIPQDGDFILGKQNGKYVCWNTKKDGHFLILGGSGTGKSSCFIIPYLLNNPDTTVMAVDIKGELVAKGTKKGDPRVCVFSPCDHNGYGFDPFYSLCYTSTEQEILLVIQQIAFSLIPLGNKNDKFWEISARNMMIGLLSYYYTHGRHNLITCIDAILGCPIKEQVEEIINSVEPTSTAYKYINQFSGLADETLTSVFVNMSANLTSFSDTDIRWALMDAPRKVSPKTLEQSKSIYLSIPDHKLAPWSGILAMIINLTLEELSKRPEGSHRIIILLDELGRIVSSGGALDSLIESITVLRSRGVVIIVALQEIETLLITMSEPKVTTLVGNCGIKIVLDASSSKTQKTVCSDWVPKYIQRKQSKSSGKNKSNNFSFEEKDRLSPSDLMTLPLRNEAVVITPLGYTMIKKCPYYKDKFLKNKFEIINNNNTKEY